MYPGPRDPDFGIFVAGMARELGARGHEVRRAVIDHRGGSRLKHARLAADALIAARRFRPDVVYGHFLVPAGLWAVLAGALARAPVVLTAHGRDVRNIGTIPGIRALTRFVAARVHAVVAVSDHLGHELVARMPALGGRVEVIDSGVDMSRFRGQEAVGARRLIGWEGEGPAFLFVGSLDERKNVVRLAEAFARIGRGRLAYVGDGPLRAELEGRPDVRVVGRVPHAAVADWMAACDVLCLPSLVEPFGQVLLEAMASERSVMTTSVGGPREFVTPEAGALVDPLSIESIEAGLRRAASLPRPNGAARSAAGRHDVRRQAARVEALLMRACDASRQRAVR